MENEYSDMVIKAKEMREALDWQLSRTAKIKEKLDSHIKAGANAKAQMASKHQALSNVQQAKGILEKDQSGAGPDAANSLNSTKVKKVVY